VITHHTVVAVEEEVGMVDTVAVEGVVEEEAEEVASLVEAGEEGAVAEIEEGAILIEWAIDSLRMHHKMRNNSFIRNFSVY
jgi:hypothetical protein